MRILFALPGLHRVSRGAEIAIIAVASELARAGGEVTLIGSGPARPGTPYSYLRAGMIPRERFEHFPKVPMFRNETGWEDASFIPGFLKIYRPGDYDVTLTCSYPWLNWALRARRERGRRPPHVFITQNGDWPARSNRSEFRLFDCEGLVCTNPDYYNANREQYRCALIPNGADLERFRPGPAKRNEFGLPPGVPLVLMASALIQSKMVGTAIEAVARLPGVHLAVAGDGPLRDVLRAQAERLLPGRFHRFTVAADRMPDVYRSADAFLHLSRDESFGNVFVEAMACGLPVVAWDLERTRWITGPGAFLACDGDEASLVGRLREALETKAPLATMTAQAANFPWHRIAQEYREFLNTVVRSRSVS